MSATLMWTAIAPAVAAAATSPGPLAHTGVAPQSGAVGVLSAPPLLIGLGLVALGVLCALVLLVAAVLSTGALLGLRTRWRAVRIARAGRTRRSLATLPRPTTVERGERDARAGLGTAEVDRHGAAVDADAVAWRPLSEDVPGVGRIEWDPQTLRTFAGQPEVLYRLAFHRWRYQQGSLSEFEAACAASHGGRSMVQCPPPPSKYAQPSSEEGQEARQSHEPSWMSHSTSP